MNKLLIIMLLIAVSCTVGCSSKDVAQATLTPETKTLAFFLLYRQYRGVEKDYALTVPEGEVAAKKAIEDIGGYVRYTTAVGNSRTIYGRTNDERHIVIDVDPYRGKNKIEIDINVGRYGDMKDINKLHNVIAANTKALIKDKPSSAEKKDENCDDTCDA